MELLLNAWILIVIGIAFALGYSYGRSKNKKDFRRYMEVEKRMPP